MLPGRQIFSKDAAALKTNALLYRFSWFRLSYDLKTHL
jgi:hypothetical protein